VKEKYIKSLLITEWGDIKSGKEPGKAKKEANERGQTKIQAGAAGGIEKRGKEQNVRKAIVHLSKNTYIPKGSPRKRELKKNGGGVETRFKRRLGGPLGGGRRSAQVKYRIVSAMTWIGGALRGGAEGKARKIYQEN